MLGERSARHRYLGIVAAVVTGIAGVLVVGLKPLLVTAYVGALHFTHGQAGALVGLDMAGAMVGNFLGSWRLYALNRPRVAAAGLIAIAVGNALSIECSTFGLLAVVRLGTGIGAGVSASVMAAVLSSTAAPERSFALYATLAFATSSVAMWLSGLALTALGVGAMFAGLAATTLVPLVLSVWLPARRTTPSIATASIGASRDAARVDRVGAGLLLVGTIAFYSATGGIYSFMGQIGLDRGVTSSGINAALGLSQIGGAVGAIVPLLLGNRIGRAVPIVCSIGVMMLCLILFAVGHTADVFALAMSGFVFGWLMFFPYLMGVCSAYDPLGRLGALDLAVQYAGLALGSALAGAVSQYYGYATLLAAAHFGYVASALLFLTAERRTRVRARSERFGLSL